jgi:PhnB protein
VKAFDATEVYVFEADGEVVAQLAIGPTMFWVEDESPENHNFSPETLGGSTERLLLVVENPEAVVHKAIAAGAREIYPVQEAHGWVLGRVVDPFGHHWEIGKPLSNWPPTATQP